MRRDHAIRNFGRAKQRPKTFGRLQDNSRAGLFRHSRDAPILQRIAKIEISRGQMQGFAPKVLPFPAARDRPEKALEIVTQHPRSADLPCALKVAESRPVKQKADHRLRVVTRCNGLLIPEARGLPFPHARIHLRENPHRCLIVGTTDEHVLKYRDGILVTSRLRQRESRSAFQSLRIDGERHGRAQARNCFCASPAIQHTSGRGVIVVKVPGLQSDRLDGTVQSLGRLPQAIKLQLGTFSPRSDVSGVDRQKALYVFGRIVELPDGKRRARGVIEGLGILGLTVCTRTLRCETAPVFAARREYSVHIVQSRGVPAIAPNPRAQTRQIVGKIVQAVRRV
jgi:hypothetical protein